MDEEPTEVIEKVDGRTTEGKNLTRLEALETTQEKILLTLAEHQKRIEECSVHR